MIGQLVKINTMWVVTNYTGINTEVESMDDLDGCMEAVIMAEYGTSNGTMYAGIELTTKKCIHFYPCGIMEYPGVQVAKGVIGSSSGMQFAK